MVSPYDPNILASQEDNNETNVIVSIAAGIGSGLVKIPLGLVSVAAEVYDAARGEGLSPDASKVAQLEKFIDESVVGDVVNGLEDKARDSAAGKITEALVQLGIPAARGAKIAGNIATKTITAIQKGKKFSLKSKNTIKGMRKANALNKAAKTARFAVTATGGAAGAALVYDVEDIGTFGDIESVGEYLPTALDRDERQDPAEDAMRRLNNRLNFFKEGVVVAPFAYGAGIVGSAIAKKGKDLAYSNSQIEKIIDKYIAQPLRPRGKKTQELFEAQMRVEGQEGAAALQAKDIVRNIDDSFKNIFAKSKNAASRIKDQDKLITEMDTLLKSGTDKIVNNKMVFQGFNPKQLKTFKSSLDNIGIGKKETGELISELINTRNIFNTFKTQLVKNGNLTKTPEFADLMSKRLKSTLSSDFSVYKNKGLIPIQVFKPTAEGLQETKEVVKRYAANNIPTRTGKPYRLPDEEAEDMVKGIFKRVTKDPVTGSPKFKYEDFNALSDGATQEFNMAKALSANKFEPGDLIQSKADIDAFRKLFGEIKDARRTIINTMQDLSSLSAKDNFYTNVLKMSDDIAKKGGRAIVYDTPRAARLALKTDDIILNKNGLQIKSPIGDELYVNPLNGKFTTNDWSEALNFAEKLPFDNLMKSNWYRIGVGIPKGLAQVAKTVLGPFTHARNFSSATAFSLATGNLFKNPVTILKNAKQSFNTIQPQMLYRNLPEDQGFYRFLLDEGVVNSSSTFQDVQGLLKDISKGGDFVERAFGKLGKRMSKIFRGAQDLYVAEDDFFKIYNFLGETDSLTKAYSSALKKGLINKMPSSLEIFKESADIVRNTVPNYAYVSNFIKGLRRSPLGNFVSFPAEIIRTSTNIVQRGIREAKDPVKRAIGLKRLAGFGTAVAVIPPTVTEVFRGLYGITREQLKGVRDFLPEWSRDDTVVVTKDKEGNYYANNFSHGFAYDTITNPIQSVIANVDAKGEEPLIKGFVEGLSRGFGKLVEPFISESIWVQAAQDLVSRAGRTKDGKKLWNEEEPAGDKAYKGIAHLVEALAPLSYPQLRRLTISATIGKDPKTGREYSFLGEAAGFVGFRNVKLNIPESMGYKITDYNRGLRNSRGLLPRPKGNVKSKDIFDGYIAGNKAWFQHMKKMKTSVENMKALGYDDKEIFEIFERRNQKKDFEYLNRKLFKPFALPEGLLEEYIRYSQKEGYQNPMTKDLYQDIKKIEKELNGISLDEDFPELRQPQAPAFDPLNMSSLIETPNVNPALMSQAPMNQGTVGTTGLTSTEQALLTPEEQAIRLRQRGMA